MPLEKLPPENASAKHPSFNGIRRIAKFIEFVCTMVEADKTIKLEQAYEPLEHREKRRNMIIAEENLFCQSEFPSSVQKIECARDSKDSLERDTLRGAPSHPFIIIDIKNMT